MFLFVVGGGGGRGRGCGVHLGIVLANSVHNKQNKTKFKELEIVYYVEVAKSDH